MSNPIRSKFEIKIRGDDIETNMSVREDCEADLVVILLSLVTGEAYQLALQRLHQKFEDGEISEGCYEQVVTTLQESLHLIQSQGDDEWTMRPSDVFGGMSVEEL